MMFDPPDAARQRCVVLANVIHQGMRLYARLDTDIRFWPRFKPQETPIPLEQQTREWCAGVPSALNHTEQPIIDRIVAVTLNPAWEAAWDRVMGRAEPSEANAYAPLTILDTITTILDLLKAVRMRLTPPFPLPESLSHRIVEAFHRMSEGTIDDLFIKQGCVADWWVVPSRPVDKQSADHVLGWIEGIHLHRPDEVVEVVQRVYRAVHAYKRKAINPNDSVLMELTALTQPAPNVVLQRYALHPTVESIAARYWTIGAYDTALMMVCTALDNAVQAKSGQSGYGANLMKTVFSANKPILKVDPRFGEQIGFMDLFAGAMGALRNARAHNAHLHQSNLTEDEAVEWLAFLSALFRVLDTSTL